MTDMNPALAAAYARLTDDERARLSRAMARAIVETLNELAEEGGDGFRHMEVGKRMRSGDGNPSAATASCIGERDHAQVYSIH